MSEIDNKRDVMMEKIVKVLKIHESATGEEKQASWELARKLMAKYRIEYEDVVNRVDGTDIEPVVEVVMDNRWYNVSNVLLQNLAVTVAENFRCRIYIRRVSQKVRLAVFVGLELDAKLASQVFKIAYETCRNNANEEVRNLSPEWSIEVEMGYLRPIDIKNSYYYDFTRGLDSGFLEQTKTDSSTEIMVIVPPEVNDYMSELNLSKSTREAPSIYYVGKGISDRAYNSGYSTATISDRLLD